MRKFFSLKTFKFYFSQKIFPLTRNIHTNATSNLGVIRENAFDELSHVESLNILNNKIDAIIELNLTESHNIRQLKIYGNHLLETPDPNTIVLGGIETIIVSINYNYRTMVMD